MDQEKRIPILSIDVQIRFRGEVYEFDIPGALKWLGALAVVGLRLYRCIHNAPQ